MGIAEQSLPDSALPHIKQAKKDGFRSDRDDDSAIANIEAQTSEDFFEEITYLKFKL